MNAAFSTFMKKVLFLLGLLLVITIPLFSDDDSLSVRVLRMPDSPDDVVRFEYNQETNNRDWRGNALFPNLEIIPSVQGDLEWESSRILRFVPRPGEMNWGALYTFELGPFTANERNVEDSVRRSFDIRVGNFEMAGKEAAWEIFPGKPRLIAPLRNMESSRYIGSRPYYLLFDQEVHPRDFQNHIILEDRRGRPISISVERPENLDSFYQMPIDESHVLAIIPYTELENGETVTLMVPSWTDPNGIRADHESLRLEAKTVFEISNLHFRNQTNSGHYEPNMSIDVNFNNFYDYNDFQESFEIIPAPLDYRIQQRNSRGIRIHLNLELGESYIVKLYNNNFQDLLGNTLNEGINQVINVRDKFPEMTIPDQAMTIEAQGETFPIRFTNLGQLDVNVRTFATPDKYIQALESNGNPQRYVRGRGNSFQVNLVEQEGNLLNREVFTNISLADNGGTGFKLLEISGEAIGSEANRNLEDSIVMNITDIGITAKVYQGGILVWLTSLSEGTPISNAIVKLYSSGARELVQGRTDSQGLLMLETPIAQQDGVEERYYLSAQLRDDQSIMVLDNDELSAPWQFSMAGYSNANQPLYGSIFTERGIYRPDETVYVKAMINPEGLNQSENPLTIQITDPRGKILLEDQMNLDDFYTADYELDLLRNAATGRYDIIISNGDSTISGNFSVEEYRVPTFLVKLESSEQQWNVNEPIGVDVSAVYYNGGTMGNREVKWSVSRYQAPIYFPQYPDFIFQSPESQDSLGTYLTEETVLNDQGEFHIEFTPDNRPSAGRLIYTVEAAVSDIDRQTYAGRISQHIHPSDIYVGVQPPAREVLSSGFPVEIPVMVVSQEGEPIANRQVQVNVEFIENHSSARVYDSSRVQMLNHRVGRSVLQQRVVSQRSAVNWTYTPTEAGIYRINFTSVGANGQEVKTFFYCTVTGNEATAWPRFDLEQIQIVRDRDSYNVGDEAILVAQSPYRDAIGLLTIERSGVLETRIIEIDSNTPGIPIEITHDMIPNAYVSVVLLRDRQHFMRDAAGYETGAPGFRIGYTQLIVNPEGQQLSVEINTDLTTVAPGDNVSIPFSITDDQGRGRTTQVTAMVVDEAVLDMTNYQTPNPLLQIYSPRPLGVRTGSNWLDLPHSRRERLEQLFPGGSDDLFARSDLDEILRNLFESTAYWNPDLRTDSQGRGTLNFTMPDNLTTYRIMLVAVDREHRYGSSDREIISQKPLMIQPVIPRFAYPDDEFTVEALVINNSPNSGRVDLAMEAQGLQVIGQSRKSINLTPGGSGTIAFQVRAGESGEAAVQFRAQMGSLIDAGEFTFPVLNPGTNITRVDNIQGSGDISLDVPSYYLEDSLTAEVVLSMTPLSELKDSVQYLMGYPNGCIEQTTSRAYPLVILEDLLPLMGVDVDRAQLKEYADAGIQRILSFQTAQGGLSYWPGSSEPHAFATAFGLTALLEARDKGYDIPQDALDGMADYLEMNLRQGRITGEMPHGSIPDGDTRALFVMTLGRLGRPQPQYINALWDKKDELTAFGLSFLAISIAEMDGGNQSLLDPILNEIEERSVQERQEAYFEGSSSGGWSMGSPLRTHGGALLAYGVTEEDHRTGQRFLQGLLSRRRNGLWGNTQENVFGMMGVYEFADQASSRSGQVSSRSRISINGSPIDVNSMEAPDPQIRRIQYTDQELNIRPGRNNEISVESSVSSSFVTLRLNYDIPLDEVDPTPVNQGFEIDRQYENMNGRTLRRNLPLGDLVRVRLRVHCPTTMHYVALTDYLPAGLEPLNSSLATTESVQRGELSMEEQKGLSVLSYQEIRDSTVSFYIDEMIPGTYEFSFTARCTTPGDFLRPPAHIEAMYEPEIYGTTSLDRVQLR